MPDSIRPIVVGVTGASGTCYAARLLRFLAEERIPAEVVVSDAATQVGRMELGLALDAAQPAEAVRLLVGGELPPNLRAWSADDLAAPIASGSFPTRGMVVVPCSLSTIGAIAAGAGRHLVHRAADVALKERRPLILVPRETPLSGIHLENLVRLDRAGAVILPACPGFYHRPACVDDLVDFVVARILDRLGIPHSLCRRYGEPPRTPAVRPPVPSVKP